MVFKILIGALMIGSIYGLLALGYSLIFKASGLMTFCQGSLLMIGAFVGLTFYGFLKLPFIIAALLTMLVMFLIGVLIEKFIIRVLIKKRANAIYIVFATISLSIIFQNFAMLVWGSETFQFPAIFDAAMIKIGGINIVPESLLALVSALLFMLLLHLFMTKTKFGTSMRAAAQDPMAASAMGINVQMTTAITWGLSAMLAGIGGMLIGPIFGVNMNMGSLIELKGFAAAVIGGYGNMYGAIIGSLLLGIVETFTAGYISSIYKDFISFFILILILIIKPSGIFGSKDLES
jgi:branched-chain amino acid transport system permease protein